MKKITVFFIVCFLFAVNLFPQTPQYYNYNNVGASSNTFPFGQTAGKAVNWIFLGGDFNQPTPAPSGYITKVYFFITTGGTRTYTNLHILMAKDTNTTLTTGTFYPGPWDTVYYHASTTLTGPTNGWMSIQLDKPYLYDSTKSLIIFVGQCAAGSGAGIYVRQNSLANIRRVWSVGGCPFVPYAGGDGAIVNFGFDIVRLNPMHYNYNTTGSNNSFPFGIAAGKMVQWLIPPAGQTGGWNNPTLPLSGGLINAVYLWIGGTYPLGPATYSEFRILMGQTNLANLTTGQFFSGPMDTVFFRQSVPLQGLLNSWVPFVLDEPKAYDPGLGLVLQIGHCGATGTMGFPVCQTSIGGVKRVWSVGGCPYTPYTTSDAYVIHSGLNIVYPTGTGNNNNNQVPDVYRLEQNYPNPFNPVTNISFAIPKAGNVKLVVYDILGREVATILNEYTKAGSYSTVFDASNLASGVYLYKISSGEFTDTKKMTLVK